MPHTWNKINHARAEKSVWLEFHIIEFEKSHNIKSDDIKIETTSILIMQIRDKNRLILQQQRVAIVFPHPTLIFP